MVALSPFSKSSKWGHLFINRKFIFAYHHCNSYSYSIYQNWFRGTFAGHLSIALQQKLGLDFQHRDILGYLSSRGNLGLVTG